MTTHTHTHKPPLPWTPNPTHPLPRHSSSSPWLGANGGCEEGRGQTQKPGSIFPSVWSVGGPPTLHCQQGSLSGLTEKGHSVLYPRDMNPSSPFPLLKTPSSILLCPSHQTPARGTSPALPPHPTTGQGVTDTGGGGRRPSGAGAGPVGSLGPPMAARRRMKPVPWWTPGC